MAFKPGQSGNPGGRPKIATEIRKEAQTHARDALVILVALMKGADKDSTRAAAAKAVLQVAGVPMSADTAPADPGAPPEPRADMTAEELEAAASEGEA